MEKDQSGISQLTLMTELMKELKVHQNGGTDYRQKTTEFALDVAAAVPDPVVFFNQSQALQIVASILTDVDIDRLKDIAKMLNTIVLYLHRQSNQSEEMKAYVKRKKQSKKPLGIIKNNTII